MGSDLDVRMERTPNSNDVVPLTRRSRDDMTGTCAYREINMSNHPPYPVKSLVVQSLTRSTCVVVHDYETSKFIENLAMYNTYR